MPDVDLGTHLDGFVQEQIERGHYRTVSDVVRAGLRLLEDRETELTERRAHLKCTIAAAFDDPRPSIPAEDAFARLRAHHAEQVRTVERGG